MNLDESFNKEIIEEKNQKESYKIPGKITLGESELTEREKKIKILGRQLEKRTTYRRRII